MAPQAAVKFFFLSTQWVVTTVTSSGAPPPTVSVLVKMNTIDEVSRLLDIVV